ERGERGERDEDETRGPRGIRRAGAAELAVTNRVALAESAKIHERAARLRAHAATVAGSTWVSLGPTEGSQQVDQVGDVVAGRINDIVVDPRDPDIVYLATSGGGVWKSFDAWSAAGAHWLPLSDAQPSLAAGALVIDPEHPDTLYLGNGDFFHTAGNTVSKTGDGGATWSAPVALEGTYPSGFASRVTGLRSIGVHGDHVLAGTDAGLYVSSDAGAHFTLVDLPNRSGDVLPEAIWTVLHIGRDHWIVSGVTGCDEQTAPLPPRTPGVAAGPDCRDGNNGEIWTSSDGETWQLATVPRPTGAGRIELAASHAGSPEATIVYAYVGAIDHMRTLGYWRSNDGGRSWRDATGHLANPTMAPPGADSDCATTDVAQFQGWYDQAIAVDPYDPDHVLIGGRLCGARTLDGTSAQPTWELVSHWTPNYDVYGTTARGKLEFVHADWQSATIIRVGGEIRALAGTDGGLFTSSNLFAPAGVREPVAWTARNVGLATHLMFSLASGDPATGNPFVLFGGLQDNGTRLRHDPARPSVFDEVIGGDGIGATLHVATSGTTYWASLQGTRLFCQVAAVDCANTNSWQSLPAVPGDPADEPVPRDSEPFSIHYANVETDTDGQSVLTHSVGQVFVAAATASGLAWQAISQDVSPDEIYLTNVAASSTIPGLYGASAASGFRGSGPSPVPFYVTAQGNTPSIWIAAKPVQPTGGAAMAAASAIAFPSVLPAGTTPGQVYLGAFRGVLDDPAQTPPPDDQGRLYRTRDFGQTWTSSVGADPAHRLPNVPIYIVKYDPVSPATIYAGTELGVYLSLDDGATWDRMGDGLPIVPVRDLYVARNQEFIRVATFGRGLWEIYPSASANHGAAGNGDYDRDQQIDWTDVAALASRLGTTPATREPPRYTWLLDVSGEGHDPPVQAIDDADLAALVAKLGGAP
ncbi:MAG: hypothetical protein ABIY55_28710, partial [Kofleriaceae bacterium]